MRRCVVAATARTGFVSGVTGTGAIRGSARWLSSSTLPQNGRWGIVRQVQVQGTSVGRGLSRARPRRNLSTEAKEEPIAHTVESLTESYYALQDSSLNIQILGGSVPRFWVGLVAFGLFGLGKDMLSLGVADQIEKRSDLTKEQKTQLSALAGDKEDFVLSQLPTAVALSDPMTLFTIPLLSSLFAASVGIWWGRFRVRKLFDKFIFLETKKGHIASPDVIEGARKGIITRGATAAAVGTMALTTTYISFYAIITRVWFREYIEFMNEWKWSVPEDKEGELHRKLPSDVELQAYSLASFFYFLFLEFLVLKFTPFVILPSLTAMVPMTAVLSQSPVFLRMQEKTKRKLAALEAKDSFGVLVESRDLEEGDDDENGYGLRSVEEEEEDAEEAMAGDSSVEGGDVSKGHAFDKTAGAKRVRAIVSRRKRQQPEQSEREDATNGEWVPTGDEGHGKENQWGDVVLEDEQNPQ